MKLSTDAPSLASPPPQAGLWVGRSSRRPRGWWAIGGIMIRIVGVAPARMTVATRTGMALSGPPAALARSNDDDRGAGRRCGAAPPRGRGRHPASSSRSSAPAAHVRHCQRPTTG